MSENGELTEDLLDISTRDISPVELNSYLCRNARVMSEFHKLLGNDEEAADYQRQFEAVRTAIDEVMWNEEFGTWFDFDLKNEKQRNYFFPSNIAPLWADCFR